MIDLVAIREEYERRGTFAGGHIPALIAEVERLRASEGLRERILAAVDQEKELPVADDSDRWAMEAVLNLFDASDREKRLAMLVEIVRATKRNIRERIDTLLPLTPASEGGARRIEGWADNEEVINLMAGRSARVWPNSNPYRQNSVTILIHDGASSDPKEA